jgi:hypothetical protein
MSTGIDDNEQAVHVGVRVRGGHSDDETSKAKAELWEKAEAMTRDELLLCLTTIIYA